MGLDLEVGSLAVFRLNDEEGFTHLKNELVRLNQALLAAGLQEHHEPEEVLEQNVFGCQMYGYSGLHYLRRIAAHEAFGLPMPPPGDDEVSKDRMMKRYYSEVAGGGFIARLLHRRRAAQLDFAHLMTHSDCEGYYIPQDFEQVIFPDTSLQIPGGMVGSSQRLLTECQRLAKLLELPFDLDHESDELWFATETQGEGETKWQRYGVESFTCIRLIRACEASLQLGAAVYFC